MQIQVALVVCFAAGLAVACGGSPSHPLAPTAGAVTPSPETTAQAATSGSVQISRDILKSCNLSDADAYFPFDSSRLERQDIAPLNTIAVCFESGSLKGHGMKLVGHADRRGGPDYNMALGQSRSDGVERYLEKRGLDRAKLETSSRGAMDATGTNEAGWARDRRVDVTLAN